ncbi:MAG: hypothetical protein ACC635_03005 [Acidiferrobacterales bacterium]
MKKIIVLTMLFFIATSSAIAAQEADSFKPKAFAFKRMYFGGGISSNDLIDTVRINGNSVSYDRTQGYQVFAGYDLGMRASNFKLLVEAGYHDSGEFKGKVKATGVRNEFRNTGPWASGVIAYEFVPRFEGFVRAGYQFQDDSGFLMGLGLGFKVIKNLSLRVEGVRRDETSSFQLNAIFHP